MGPFDREKLTKSILTALRKRPIDNDTIEKFVSKIYRSLEDLGQNEIMSSTIGKFVMDGLKELDHVGYVRFASVYIDFKEANNLDNYFLNLSNKLSEINQFETFPNPCVGAVLVNKNKIETSYTGKKGSPHAEYQLLKNKNNLAKSLLYTSLEPCCHKGKNPACVDIIIKKKNKKNLYE